jgi:hypothetical protein
LAVDYHLQAVLDLTVTAVQQVFGTTVVELCAPWRTLNAGGVPAPTQILGQVLHGEGSIEALRVPSARDPATDNLVILPDRLQAGSTVRVFDDSGVITHIFPERSPRFLISSVP